MAARLSNEKKLEISKGQATTINHFRLGVHLSQLSGHTIDELVQMACSDRLSFAKQLLSSARWVLESAKPHYRTALARAYYAMYHAARAVIFFHNSGDDHEEHSKLPKHIPGDFPDRSRWENELKTARLERNKADYDPYPKSDKAFESIAMTTFKTAEEFLLVTKQYLVKRRCKL
jgi:uncharacterized protein (UPF0332 family)